MAVECLDLGSVKWVPVSVARKTLRVTRQRVYQLIENGSLAAVRVDGALMVSTKSIDLRMTALTGQGSIFDVNR